MKAKNYINRAALHIYTDFDLSKDEGKLDDLLQLLFEYPGIESVESNRYSIAITFGLLFNINDMMADIFDIFKSFYVDCSTPITAQEIIELRTVNNNLRDLGLLLADGKGSASA